MKNMTYGSYLRLEELIDLQTCLSDGPEHDELLFITIHQIYELWFKQVLHESQRMIGLLEQSEITRAQHTLKRILKIFKTLVQQLDILETMTPLEFTSFREFLGMSSGFQSYQFREIEFILGKKDKELLEGFKDDKFAYARLEKRLNSKSMWRVFLELIQRKGFDVPASILDQANEVPTEKNKHVQTLLIDIYRHHPDFAGLCESMVDLDEGLQEWRYRHFKMVQRTIGAKMGTGGSSGTEYLMSTLFSPVFPDLWEIRTEF